MSKNMKDIIMIIDGTLVDPSSNLSHMLNIKTLIPANNANDSASHFSNDKQGWSVDKYYKKNATTMVKYYDRGLGAPTTNWYGKVKDCSNPLVYEEKLAHKFKQIKEAAFGIGITDNVAQAYHFLAENYETKKNDTDDNTDDDADKVYCYGFSRGAYTLLLLVAMIRQIGLINIHGAAFKQKYNTNLQQAILDGFGYYDSEIHPDKNEKARDFKATYCHDGKHLIHFLGLLEPVKGLVIETLHAGNHISNVAKHTSIAYAINEKRALYKPGIYIPSEESYANSVWIPGSHSDTGGSRNNGLANISLHWIMQETMRYGLPINTTLLNKNFPTNPLDVQHNSMADKVPFTTLYWHSISPKEIRKIPVNTHEGHTIHPSTYERFGQTVKTQKKSGVDKTITYRPKNVSEAVAQLNHPQAHEQHSSTLLYNYNHGYAVPPSLPLTEEMKAQERINQDKLKALSWK